MEPRGSSLRQEVIAEKKRYGKGGEIKQGEALWNKEANGTWKEMGRGFKIKSTELSLYNVSFKKTLSCCYLSSKS